MKLCLPRKARSLAKSQLSAACAKQIAERGEGLGRPHSSTGSRDRGALQRNKNISGHRGGRLPGRSEGAGSLL